jgi:hypothetical protein
VLTFAHVVNFLPHKLSCLRAGRFSLAGIATSAVDSFFLWHTDPPQSAYGGGMLENIKDFL